MGNIRKKEMDFLSGEIDEWTEQKIITREQAEKILSLYDVKERNLRVILFAAGMLLVFLGAASFIAAKWRDIGKNFRVVIIGGAYILSLAAYLTTKNFYPRTSRVILLLGSVIFGAGIYLLTRTFGYYLEWYYCAGWWAVQLVITAAIFRDAWQLYFSQIISLVYLNAINAIDFFALQFATGAKISASQFFSPVNAFALIAALWAGWLFVRDRAAFIMNMLLAILLFASRMSLCFGGTWTLIILAAFGAVLSFLPFGNDAQIFGLMMLGLFGLLLTWPEFWQFKEFWEFWPICVALISAIVMLVNIYRGHAVTGIIFCVMLASRYFLDNLFGYMPKAWGFTLAGIVLMIAGFIFERLRKRA